MGFDTPVSVRQLLLASKSKILQATHGRCTFIGYAPGVTAKDRKLCCTNQRTRRLKVENESKIQFAYIALVLIITKSAARRVEDDLKFQKKKRP